MHSFSTATFTAVCYAAFFLTPSPTNPSSMRYLENVTHNKLFS